MNGKLSAPFPSEVLITDTIHKNKACKEHVVDVGGVSSPEETHPDCLYLAPPTWAGPPIGKDLATQAFIGNEKNINSVGWGERSSM